VLQPSRWTQHLILDLPQDLLCTLVECQNDVEKWSLLAKEYTTLAHQACNHQLYCR